MSPPAGSQPPLHRAAQSPLSCGKSANPAPIPAENHFQLPPWALAQPVQPHHLTHECHMAFHCTPILQNPGLNQLLWYHWHLNPMGWTALCADKSFSQSSKKKSLTHRATSVIPTTPLISSPLLPPPFLVSAICRSMLLIPALTYTPITFSSPPPAVFNTIICCTCWIRLSSV